MPRGRPKLTEAEKAKRAEERKAQKRAAYQAKKEAGITDSDLAVKLYAQMQSKTTTPVTSPEEADVIQRMEKIMANAAAKQRLQVVVPKEQTTTMGNRELVHVARAQEASIEEEPADPRPDFVKRDEKGWEEF